MELWMPSSTSCIQPGSSGWGRLSPFSWPPLKLVEVDAPPVPRPVGQHGIGQAPQPGPPAERGVARPARRDGGGAAAAGAERDALRLPRTAGATTGLVELGAGAGRVRDPAVDERAAAGPGTRGLRDRARAGTR